MHSDLARSSSPTSSTSSPSLQFSDLSATSSATDIHLTSSARYRFIAATGCRTLDDLVSCLKSSSFENDSLVLAVGCETAAHSAASLDETIRRVEEVLHEECNLKLDVRTRKSMLHRSLADVA